MKVSDMFNSESRPVLSFRVPYDAAVPQVRTGDISDLPTTLPPLGPLLVRAEALVIECQADAEAGAALLTNELIPPQRMIREWFADPKARAHELHKDLCARETAALRRYAEPETIVRRKLADYQREQEAIRRQAETEAMMARSRLEEEMRLQVALQREAAGDVAGAEAAIEDVAPPVAIPMPSIPTPTQVAGVRFAKRLTAEVTDIKLLARAVAEGTVPEDVLSPNLARLNQLARALGPAGFRVPGVRLVEVTNVRAGRALRVK